MVERGMETITGVERRRRWRDQEKLRILAELDEPGARFNDVARRHDVSRGLLWQWRGLLTAGDRVEGGPGLRQPRQEPGDQPARGGGEDRVGDRAELLVPQGL